MNVTNRSHWSEVRNTYFEKNIFPEEGEALARIAIDAWETNDPDAPGEVVANVMLSNHGDILVSYNDNLARIDPAAQECIRDAREQLKAYHQQLQNENQKVPSREVDELTVRLSYYAGTLEASHEISAPEWDDLCAVISKCISSYYEDEIAQTPSSIEDLADRMFKEAFPPNPPERSSDLLSNSAVAGDEVLLVRLAHLAGVMEVEDVIANADWDEIIASINIFLSAYLNDPSESINPFDLDDAAERYFITRFGRDEFREAAIRDGWFSKSVEELISDAKKNTRAPHVSLSEPSEPTIENKNAGHEDDKAIFIAKETGELCFFDSVGKEDLLNQFGETFVKDSFIGVFTCPECVAATHPARVSALWDDIPSDYQDQPSEDLLASLEFGKEYDVCYYFTKEGDTSTLYQGVDSRLTKGEIIINLATNKYMEGAVFCEHQRLLQPEEYLSGMRYNAADAKLKMSEEQLFEVQRGIDCGVSETLLLRPELSAAELLKLRTELETENQRKEDPTHLYEATDYGPELLALGFKSESNFAKYPERVCYVPENWDFDDGPGITGKDIIDLCKGDLLKAEIVFDRCEWQFPSTILDNEWDISDDQWVEELRRRQSTQSRPAFADLLNSAKDRANTQQDTPQDIPPHR